METKVLRGIKVRVKEEVTLPNKSGDKIKFSDYPNGVIECVWHDPEEEAFKVRIAYDATMKLSDWERIYGSIKQEKP